MSNQTTTNLCTLYQVFSISPRFVGEIISQLAALPVGEI